MFVNTKKESAPCGDTKVVREQQERDVSVSPWRRKDTHLGREDIIRHVPEPGPPVRGVGEGEAFHLGGDGADDGVVLLVGLPHHANVPARTGEVSAPHCCCASAPPNPQLGLPHPPPLLDLPHHVEQDENLDEPEHTSHPGVGDDQRFGGFVIKRCVETLLAEVCGLAHLCSDTHTHSHTHQRGSVHQRAAVGLQMQVFK